MLGSWTWGGNGDHYMHAESQQPNYGKARRPKVKNAGRQSANYFVARTKQAHVEKKEQAVRQRSALPERSSRRRQATDNSYPGPTNCTDYHVLSSGARKA